jgi:cell shape-determining protein MreC
MSSLRFHHVFFGLMVCSAAVAFLVPAQYGAKFQPQVQVLFAPVSRPAGAIAAVISNRVAPATVDDRRTTVALHTENEQLRVDVDLLRTQLEEIYRQNAELGKLGLVKDLCRLVKVVGGDAGTRESLAITASSLEGIKEDMYVLHPGGLVGQVQRAGIGGAQVRLITDPAFRIRIRFVRYTTVSNNTQFEFLGTPVVLAEGAGTGTLVVRGLLLSDIGYDATGKPGAGGETLRDGDYALLYDRDCPRRLQGEPIGRVVRISARTDARGFAEVRLQPGTNLKKLREVMVMVKE